jgi:hypothetical protein
LSSPKPARSPFNSKTPILATGNFAVLRRFQAKFRPTPITVAEALTPSVGIEAAQHGNCKKKRRKT